jgi:hypothetical protein
MAGVAMKSVKTEMRRAMESTIRRTEDRLIAREEQENEESYRGRWGPRC